METANHSFPWLALMDRPAFCVQYGHIIAVNLAAKQLQLYVGMNIDELLAEHREDYNTFTGECLYLTLTISGIPYPACVTKAEDYDIFQIRHEEDIGCLQALSLAATQLRMPLGNILAVTDRLFSKLEDTNDEAQEQVGHINQNLYRLLRIVSNMTDAVGYRNSTGMQTTDLTAVIDEIMEKAQVLFADTGMQLQYKGPNTAIYSLANPEKLERAIYNLLSNAAQFSKTGSTVITALAKNGNQLTFAVTSATDDALTETELWKRYRRKPAIEDPRHGLGLGMTLVSAVAAAHKGTVLVDHPTESQIRVAMTIPIVKETSGAIHSPTIRIGDYAGGRDTGLLELSNVLPADAYKKIN